MDGCSRWRMDEGTKEGNDAFDFFFYCQRKKSGRRRWGWQREGGKFSERWRLNWGFRDEFFKATTRQSHWQSIEKKPEKNEAADWPRLGQSATVTVDGDHSEIHNGGGLTCCLLNHSTQNPPNLPTLAILTQFLSTQPTHPSSPAASSTHVIQHFLGSSRGEPPRGAER